MRSWMELLGGVETQRDTSKRTDDTAGLRRPRTQAD